ncbi:hypothetical protein D3C79_1108670 [compost metagenome]
MSQAVKQLVKNAFVAEAQYPAAHFAFGFDGSDKQRRLRPRVRFRRSTASEMQHGPGL